MQGTSLPFGLYFLVIYGSFVDRVDSTRFKYMKIEDLEGHTCPANETLFDNERSVVQCASMCSEKPTCRGVVIQPQDFRCIGCKDRYLTSDRAPLLSGTHYYRLQNARYRVVEEEKTWFEAKAYCEGLEARLADIKTEEEEEFIENYVIFDGNFRHEGNCFCGNDACGVPNKTVT